MWLKKFSSFVFHMSRIIKYTKPIVLKCDVNSSLCRLILTEIWLDLEVIAILPLWKTAELYLFLSKKCMSSTNCLE